MLPELFTALAVAGLSLGQTTTLAEVLKPAPPAYKTAQRIVTNWRFEAARNLDLALPIAAKLVTGTDPQGTSRCVRLNNYWCVKRAGWAGEIAADAEGHVAFSSAQEGASVAAFLLRRYYMDFELKSAQSIISRWAPAQCTPVIVAGKPGAKRNALAARGLGNTLRARWLASRGQGGKKVARRALRRSVVADRTPALMRAPSIAVGMGERQVALPTMTLANLTISNAASAPSGPAQKFTPQSCPSENQRIRNYAMNAIRGIAQKPEDDLKLFEADGTPTPNLETLLNNMASVEIGPLRVNPYLVAQAMRVVSAAKRPAIKKNSQPVQTPKP